MNEFAYGERCAMRPTVATVPTDYNGAGCGLPFCRGTSTGSAHVRARCAGRKQQWTRSKPWDGTGLGAHRGNLRDWCRREAWIPENERSAKETALRVLEVFVSRSI